MRRSFTGFLGHFWCQWARHGKSCPFRQHFSIWHMHTFSVMLLFDYFTFCCPYNHYFFGSVTRLGSLVLINCLVYPCLMQSYPVTHIFLHSLLNMPYVFLFIKLSMLLCSSSCICYNLNRMLDVIVNSHLIKLPSALLQSFLAALFIF